MQANQRMHRGTDNSHLLNFYNKIVAIASYIAYITISCNNILLKETSNLSERWKHTDKHETESHGQYISAIYRHMQVLISAELEPYRIGSGQYIFLMAIASQQPITQKALSEKLLIDKTTTAKAVAKLESEGYVRREVDSSDNRYQQLYLTESGHEVAPKVQEVLDRVKSKTKQGIADDEYDLFVSQLKIVLRNLSRQEER
ncbi:MarR family winged helix-turn-helix transcriptional regulator [Paenibacillus sp. GSMTC-2017]|uniref:MarR family winged helix-turn-helix transcriptional regulator n=1 Tax=Paenibacillus sp. GSMTC-2017 TaxID=2794350 RepID=UPI001E3437DD|nr:MarR family winged helix-turn-helix transcriptional regulator [Paenibacillus sp. GSMTC-2017]